MSLAGDTARAKWTSPYFWLLIFIIKYSFKIMRRFYFLVIMFFSCSCQNVDKNTEDTSDVKMNQDVGRNEFIGNWICKGGNGGVTNIYSVDSVEIELANNQLWVLAKIIKVDTLPNIAYLYFKNTKDVGAGFNDVIWNDLAKDKPIGKLEKINDTIIIKTSYAFYNEKMKKYDDLAFDWDSCDTLYPEKMVLEEMN